MKIGRTLAKLRLRRRGILLVPRHDLALGLHGGHRPHGGDRGARHTVEFLPDRNW